MCGRYTLTADLFNVKVFLGVELANDLLWAPNWKARFNIAPTQMAPVLSIDKNGQRSLGLKKWGLIPSWSKDEKIAHKMINARSETVAEKPSFRAAFQKRRCLVPIDSFYEWQRQGDHKTPMRIRLKGQELFAVVGLWESWTSPQGEVTDTFTLLTTEANEFMRPIHDRMPVILPPQQFEAWLNPKEASREKLQSMLVPYDSRQMDAYAVSTLVNSPKNDRPECIEPVAQQQDLIPRS